MKDIIISTKRIKKELVALAVCFLIGFGANVGAVIAYKSPAIEILTSLRYVLIAALALYIFVAAIRVIFALVSGWLKKPKK